MIRLLKSVLLVSVLVVIVTFSLCASGVLPFKSYLIHTGSMGQTITPGSVVLVREHQYHVGQIVTFVADGSIVTHRLMAINSNGIITTKGDANSTVDPWDIPRSKIIGGVVYTIPVIGYFLKAIESLPGLIWFLCAVLFWWQVLRSNNESKLIES